MPAIPKFLNEESRTLQKILKKRGRIYLADKTAAEDLLRQIACPRSKVIKQKLVEKLFHLATNSGGFVLYDGLSRIREFLARLYGFSNTYQAAMAAVKSSTPARIIQSQKILHEPAVLKVVKDFCESPKLFECHKNGDIPGAAKEFFSIIKPFLQVYKYEREDDFTARYIMNAFLRGVEVYETNGFLKKKTGGRLCGVCMFVDGVPVVIIDIKDCSDAERVDTIFHELAHSTGVALGRWAWDCQPVSFIPDMQTEVIKEELIAVSVVPGLMRARIFNKSASQKELFQLLLAGDKARAAVMAGYGLTTAEMPINLSTINSNRIAISKELQRTHPLRNHHI